MQPSTQSVEEVKRVVAEARAKAGAAPLHQPDFNEEDYMDGALPKGVEFRFEI